MTTGAIETLLVIPKSFTLKNCGFYVLWFHDFLNNGFTNQIAGTSIVADTYTFPTITADGLLLDDQAEWFNFWKFQFNDANSFSIVFYLEGTIVDTGQWFFEVYDYNTNVAQV